MGLGRARGRGAAGWAGAAGRAAEGFAVWRGGAMRRRGLFAMLGMIGKKAGLPEGEHLVEAAENARENGHDQGVKGGRHPGTLVLCLEGGVDLGQLGGQSGRLDFHSPVY